MKTTTLTVLILLVGFVSSAQQQIFNSNFENWTSDVPDGWNGDKTNINLNNISEISTGAVYGNKVCRLEETSGSHKRFTTENLSIDLNETYQIEIWVKGEGEIRVGLHNGGVSPGYQGYSSYETVNGTSNTLVTRTIIAEETNTNAQFILSIRNTVAPNHLEIDSVAITKLPSAAPTTVSIYDIQFTTATGTSPSPLVNQVVNTGGIVSSPVFTDNNNQRFFIQDASGAWNGIMVESSENVSIGDSITFTGLVDENFGFTYIKNITNFNLESSNNPLHATVTITTDEVNEEKFESVLVNIANATVSNANTGFGQFEINDNSGPCLVGNVMYEHNGQQLNDVYDITGVVYYSFSEFKILPRTVNDIILGGSTPPVLTNIYDIQFTTDASGDSPMLGQFVTTSGIVTATGSGFFFLQDGPGAWNGIMVFTNSITPAVGDSLSLNAKVDEYFGMTQLTNVSNATVISSGNTLPATELVTVSQIDESFESVLIQVENATCTDDNAGFGMWQINDGTGAHLVDPKMYSFTPDLGVTYMVTGVINYEFSNFRISPRIATDVQVQLSTNNFENNNIKLYPNPAKQNFKIEGDVHNIKVMDVVGKEVYNNQNYQGEQIDISNWKNGVYFVQVNGSIKKLVKN